jgi:hypothetical protein
MALEIRTADELADPRRDPRFQARRSGPRADVLRAAYTLFVEQDGPVSTAEVERACAAIPPEAVREALAALDAEDLIVLDGDRIVTAYPFAGEPTPFVVDLPGGRRRHACCAIDALGLAPMLGRQVAVRSRCHHCGEPLELVVAAAGPVAGPGAASEVMVWVADRGCDTERRTSSL